MAEDVLPAESGGGLLTLLAALKAKKPDGEVLPLINEAAAQQIGEVRRHHRALRTHAYSHALPSRMPLRTLPLRTSPLTLTPAQS